LTRLKTPAFFAPHPEAVNQPLFDRIEIGVIRFTRRIASQCSRDGRRIPDWVVCDTIANGSRRRGARRGTRGGPIVRFERTFAAGAGDAAITVRVLGELTRKGCFALQLLLPARIPKKIWKDSGFLNRAGSK
jgi:hypothetical protein